MPEIIACPQCGRQLSVQDSLLGQSVKCPACQTTFTAELGPPRPPREDVQRESPRERPREDEYEEHRRPRRDEDEDYEDRPRRRRYEEDDYGIRDMKPHRAGTVLTLGILGLVLSCIPLAGWILGGIAISMANTDLREMARRQMDRSGEGSTQAGKVCGIIGVILASIVAVFSCIIRLSHIR